MDPNMKMAINTKDAIPIFNDAFFSACKLNALCID
jgi:hypothetical protein